ncbi:MAG: hypothetical protein WBL40_20180 [Terrimicrobiaceae bacterium]
MPALGQRKEPEIPVEKIKQLASIGCTDEEIGLIAGIDDSTLQRRFAPLLKEGRAAFKAEIRGMQRRRCLDGSDTMLIWLGKVVLHQKERTDITLEANDTLAAFIDSIREAGGPRQLAASEHGRPLHAEAN